MLKLFSTTPTHQKINLTTLSLSIFNESKIEDTSERPKFVARPVSLATFSTKDKLKDSLITNSKQNQIPKEVIVNSHTIKTDLTPEIANNILKMQQQLNEDHLHITTTPSYETETAQSDANSFPFSGANLPEDIDPSDVLKLAYGGSFNMLESDEDQDREKAIDRLIQQLEREYNNSLARKRPSSDVETGGKSQLTKIRPQVNPLNKFRPEEYPLTTSKWVYLSGADIIQTPSPTGLTLTASNAEILNLIKTMEKEVNQTMNNDDVAIDESSLTEPQVKNENESEKNIIENKAETNIIDNDSKENDENESDYSQHEIIYLNDETLLHFMDDLTTQSSNVPEKEVEMKMDDTKLNPEINSINTDFEETEPIANEETLAEIVQEIPEEVTPPQLINYPLVEQTTPSAIVIENDSNTEGSDLVNNTPPFPLGPLFVRSDAAAATTTTTTTTTTASTTTLAPTAIEILTNVLSQSAAPLAGLSAASLAYGAAAMLPLWLPLALGKKKRRRRKRNFDLKDQLMIQRLWKMEN
jgi:hypothetical protein